MDRDLRASLIASGAAAVLSMIVGIVSGVEFFVLLLRALVGGLLFGGLVYGAFFLLRRYVPDLVASPEKTESEVEPELGSKVDIVLQGEGPQTEAQSPEDLDESMAFTREAPSPSKAGRSPVETGADTEDFLYANESLLDEPTEAEAVTEEPVASSALEAHAAPSGVSSGIDDLDVLPDLESLSDGFVPLSHEMGGASTHEYEESEPRNREPRGKGEGADPAMLAKAVRTLLKRDQER